MKLVIASDIHGSAFWCRKLLEVCEKEQPEKLILLGQLRGRGGPDGTEFSMPG